MGQVGWELGRTLAPLGRLVCIDFPEIDLANAESIRRWMRETAPAVVVNAAAYTAVDKAETETERCQLVNGVAPGILAEEARTLGALTVHYSTDYVYDGTKTSAYVEEDAVNPLSAYGRSKLAGDQAVQQAGGAHLIFRLCWVYGARGHNFMLTMMRLAREREQLRVVADQVGCPTWAGQIAQVTALALHQVLRSGDPRSFSGLYHLAAAGQTSWHGFASAIVGLMPEASRKCRRVEAISTDQYPLPARRPAFSVLSTAKLQRHFGLTLPPWQEGLARVLETA